MARGPARAAPAGKSTERCACAQMADAEGVVRRWLSACVTAGGVLAARQALHARPLLVAQMLEEWLNHYRRLA